MHRVTKSFPDLPNTVPYACNDKIIPRSTLTVPHDIQGIRPSPQIAQLTGVCTLPFTAYNDE